MDDYTQLQHDVTRFASRADGLAKYLRCEADWMEGRAAVLDQLAGIVAGGRGKRVVEAVTAIRAEAARFRARAVLARVEAGRDVG